MKHFLFCETNSGEEFIVGDFSLRNAKVLAREICREIAINYADNEHAFNCEYCGELTDEEAEMSGLDEY